MPPLQSHKGSAALHAGDGLIEPGEIPIHRDPPFLDSRAPTRGSRMRSDFLQIFLQKNLTNLDC